MRLRRVRAYAQALFAGVVLLMGSAPAVSAQQQAGDSDEQSAGAILPESERLRIRARFMAGYGNDRAQFGLGFENQGRVGYAIIDLSGKLSSRASYFISINPVDEVDALPSCGEEGYFYPNEPSFLGAIGPNFQCDPEGIRRVDMYKYIALDLVNQQGPIREAWLNLALTQSLGFRFGRFILPMGFGWEEVGSYTSKDATRIQRINAESNFGLMLSWTKTRQGRKRPLLAGHAAGFLGDGNRNRDYSYFYFADTDLDSNSALTMMFAGTFSPTDAIDLRISGKRGFSGSRVERLPNYWAMKRHDHALILSARYQPIPYASVFGEGAFYTWGPTRTSAELLGLDEDPIRKNGYYFGAEGAYPLTDTMRIGANVTREELSRNDSLVKFFAEQGDPRVALGEFDRGTVMRFFLGLKNVTFAYYRNLDETPFPFLSGIIPADAPIGDAATDKWGIVVRASVP